MLETPHVAVGIAIASKVTNPLISLPLALASHFILDKTPHWNPHLNLELRDYGKVKPKTKLFITADSTLALVIGLYAVYNQLPNTNMAMIVFAGAFLSVLPDVVEIPHYFLEIRTKLMDTYIKWQKSIQFDVEIKLGIAIQTIVTLASLFVAFS